MRLFLLFASTLVLVLTAPAYADDLKGVEGVWSTGGAHVKIAKCSDAGSAETPCGTIVWLNPETTADYKDSNNPDPTLRSRDILGITLLQGFTGKNNRWVNGTIYDPANGNTYKSHIRQRKDGKLQVKGCIGPFCQTQVWDKVG